MRISSATAAMASVSAIARPACPFTGTIGVSEGATAGEPSPSPPLPTISRVLLAVTCPVCGGRGRAPCPGCLAELRPAPLLAPPPGVDACHALLAYEGAGRELV